MKQSTLVSRVARVQTMVTIAALATVVLGTACVVTAGLKWKTDQHVESVLGRVGAYLVGQSPDTVDWVWLAKEVDEVRPREMRVEIRVNGKLRHAAGEGDASGAKSGCISRGFSRICVMHERGFEVSALRSRNDDLAAARSFEFALAAFSLAVGLLVALVSRWVTRRAIRPLSDLAQRVAQVEPGSGERVSARTNLQEVDMLAERFDMVVARFEAALEREQRFTAEASHELRTPLTIAMAEMEALVRGEDDGGAPGRAIEALGRLSSLAEALLWFAKAQAKEDYRGKELVNLADTLREQVEQLRRANPAQAFHLSAPDEALVHADEHLLRQSLGNLLDNAVKYADASKIEVWVERADEMLAVHVVNGGEGIAGDDQARIFVPFFRAKASASRAHGFGLGLPFVRAVSRAHGGDTELVVSERGRTEFVLRLPLAGWSDLVAVDPATNALPMVDAGRP